VFAAEWLFGGRKMTAAWHRGPAVDFIQPFGPFPAVACGARLLDLARAGSRVGIIA
jgi:hypothetical protein